MCAFLWGSSEGSRGKNLLTGDKCYLKQEHRGARHTKMSDL